MLAAMGMDVIDERTLAAIRRLTQAERECLSRRLDHQTAKKMALELGVSPHAVEKRLKMARAKLGLSSSLEAAKLLEAAERSGRLGPHFPDLPLGAAPADDDGSEAAAQDEIAWTTRPRAYWVTGAMVMSAIAAMALIIGVQSSGAGERQPGPLAAGATASLVAPDAQPTPGTEAALRRLVTGLAKGAPDYGQLSPQFAEVVRRDLPMTHGLFTSLGELKAMTFHGRGAQGDDAYSLVFANGEVMMSAALDPEGRMAGGFLQPMRLPHL